MKQGLWLIGFIFLFVFNANEIFGQCTNCLGQWPPGTSSTTSSALSTVSTCMFGGDYAVFNVTAGETYTWTTCGSTAFDTQLTLYGGAAPGCQGVSLAYNDDDCGLQSTITWTATFTGTVNVLVSQWNCQSNITCIPLLWACTSCGGGGADITTCNGNFYDSGGPGGNYSNNENTITTICPDVADQCVSVLFNSFNLESGFDFLTVHDGPTTGSPIIGTYSGFVLQGTTISATNLSGCLTFRFESDGSVTQPGWNATISCNECSVPPPAPPTDCIGGITVCDDATFSGNSSGSGSINDLNITNQGCLGSGENQSSWYLFSPASDGDIGFTISPGIGVDYDFAVWGPFPEGSTAADLCPPTGLPIRCSYASGFDTYNQTGSYDTGMGHPQHSAFSSAPPAASATFTNQCENPGGCTFSVCLYDSFGDGWDNASLTVQVNAVNALTNITLANGTGPVCYNFNVPQNGTITVNYTTGFWPGENTYAVFDQPNGGGNPILQFDSPNNTYSQPPAGNGWVPGLEVTAGEVYVMVIDNFSSNSTPFDLNWNLQNGATLDCTPLPVELIEFTGTPQGPHNVLRWTTASETNSDYFSVERSADGANYQQIGTVQAAGFSNSPLSYVYRDENPGNQRYYYRLKQVDFDGKFEYLGPVAIDGMAETSRFGKPYPNPSESGEYFIEVNFTHNLSLQYTLLDATGRPVLQKSVTVSKGHQTLQIDGSRLASGVYQLQFSDDLGQVLHTTSLLR